MRLLGFLQEFFDEIRAETVLTLAVDVEVRGTLHADFGTELEILVDAGVHSGVKHHVLLELFNVQANFLGDGEINGIGEFAAMRSERVAVFPELALLVCCDRRCSGGTGVRMEAEREVLVDELDLVGVLLVEFLHHRSDTGAVRALELGKFNNRELRVLGVAENRAVFVRNVPDLVVGFHFSAGLFERDAALVESVLDDFEFFLDLLEFLFQVVEPGLLVERTAGGSLITGNETSEAYCDSNNGETFHVFPF